LETPSTSNYFAYDSLTHVLVPITDAAAEQFPALMPPGDVLTNVHELIWDTNNKPWEMVKTFVQGNEIKLPGNWCRAHQSVR